MTKKLNKEQFKKVVDFLHSATVDTTEKEVNELLSSMGCNSLEELQGIVIEQTKGDMTEEQFKDTLATANAICISELPTGNRFDPKQGSYYRDLKDPAFKENWVHSPYTFACADSIVHFIDANYIGNTVDIDKKDRNAGNELERYLQSTGNDLISMLIKTLAFKMNAIISSFYSAAFSRITDFLHNDPGLRTSCDIDAAYTYYFNHFPGMCFKSNMYAANIVEMIFTSNDYRFISGLDVDTDNIIFNQKFESIVTNVTLSAHEILSEWLFVYLPLVTSTTPMWFVQQLNDLSVMLHNSIYDLCREMFVSVEDAMEKGNMHYNNAFTVLRESPQTGLDSHKNPNIFDF